MPRGRCAFCCAPGHGAQTPIHQTEKRPDICDLKEAEIADVDDADQQVDFHSLRHTTGSLLAANATHRLLNPCDFEKYSCCMSTVGGDSIYNTVALEQQYIGHRIRCTRNRGFCAKIKGGQIRKTA